MKKNLSLLLMCVCSLVAYSQSKLSNYTRAYLLGAENTRREVQGNREASVVSAFVHFNDAIDIALLEKYGASVESKFESLKVVTATIPVSQLEALAKEEAIYYIEMATPVYPQLNVAHAESGVDKIHMGTDQSTRPYLGSNVIVGIIDYGFQYTHPAFMNSNASASRIVRVWEQESYGGVTPEGYSYGREYSNPTELVNKKYDSQVDNIGHGMHVAGIATGSNNQYNCGYSGVAPNADVVLVSYRMQQVSTSLANAVEYIFKYADEVGRPAVINMSLGQQSGPHDGTSTLDKILDELQGEGKIICGAVGNDGKRKIHMSKVFTEEDTLGRSIADFYFKSMRQVTIDMWGEENNNFEIKALVYDADNDTILYQSDYFSTADAVGKSFFGLMKDENGKNIVQVKFTVTTEISPLNQKPHIMFIPNVTKLPEGNVYVGFELKSKDAGIVHAWADGQYGGLSNKGLEGWIDGDNQYTVNEIGGTAKRVISVGAYTTREHEKFKETLGHRCNFSNIGPTPDGRIKPNILAPGSAIVSSITNSPQVMPNTTAFIEAASVKYNGDTHYYGYMDGTSMATPYITGIIATWLEHNWKLTPEEAMDILAQTARTDEFTGSELPNNEMGYGKVDAYKGLLKLLELYTGVEDVERAGAMMLYPNPTSGAFNIGFVRNSENVDVKVYEVNGQLIMSEYVGAVTPGMDSQFNLGSIENGAYIVKVSGENINETFRLLVVK